MNPLVTITDGKVVTTSLKVAEVFGKLHRNVLMAIREIEAPEDFNRLNFKPVEYTDAKGEKRPMYQITRDGFTLLAMGFTGKKAMEFKIAYIKAFNEMEEALKKGTAASGSTIDPLEAMLNLADQMFDGGREEFLRKIAATQTDLLQSTIRMLNALNVRIEKGENVPAHILKYAWNMANCTRTRSLAQFQTDDDYADIQQVFSAFAPGRRIPKSEIYKAYCDSTAHPVSPRAFWPNAKKAVNLRESSSCGNRYVTIIL